MEVTSPSKTQTVVIANNTAISNVITAINQLSGFIIVPAAWTDANIGFKICDTQGGTFVIACDDTGTPIQVSGITTNASKAYRIPSELFPAHYLQLWSKSTTSATITDTNQGAERSLVVILK